MLASAVTLAADQPLPPELRGVGVDERLGQSVDLNLTFTAENGYPVRLGSFFHPGRPVLLNLVYYSCPMLCTLLLNGQTTAYSVTNNGAVSAQVARSMALGALSRTGADLAVAVTGVSGPGGGSPGKPVGLTYVAVADRAGVEVRRFAWDGDRPENRDASARAALELLLERASASVESGGKT